MKLVEVALREQIRDWRGAALLPGKRRTWVLRLTTEDRAVTESEISWLPRSGPEPDVPALVGIWAWGWMGRPLPSSRHRPALAPCIDWAITSALASFEGWKAPDSIAENGLLADDGGTPEDVAHRWSTTLAASPLRTWKVKVGRGSFTDDLARLRALQIPEGVQLRLDPNRRWGNLDPLEVADALAGLPIAYVEEPAPWPVLARWAAVLPCAADESVADVPLPELAASGVQAVVLKPSVIGALCEVERHIDEAHALGLQVVLSSALEGPIGRGQLEALVGRLPEPRAAAGFARHALVDPPMELFHPVWAVDTDPLEHAAALWPNAVALETSDIRLTFAEWSHRAHQEAIVLGDRTGETLALTIAGPDDAIRLFALLRAGATAALVPPGVQREAAMEQVGARSWSSGTGWPPGLRHDRPATFLWSSGSQGTPSAIAHTLGQHLASAHASQHTTPFVEGDRWLASLKMHHVGGLALLFRALVGGGTVVFPAGRPPEALAPTHLSWVPTQLMRADETPPSTLKHVLIGGAAAPPDLIDRRRALGWPLQTTYGSTENASQACTSRTNGPPEASGRPLPGTVVEASPVLRVFGPSVCLGVYREGLQPVTDAEGFLRTGDVGELRDGVLHVTGRADTMFISGGENVFPEAIEKVLGAHPAVRAVVVVDVPDAEWGARPWAFVDGALTLDEARAHCAGRLPRYAWVDRVLPWDAQGVGTTGKPRRAWFRSKARTLAGDGPGSP